MLNALLVALAVAGGLALVARLVRSLARLGIAYANATASAGLRELCARRGDLSTMAEHAEHERAARRATYRDGLWSLAWLAALLLPPALGWAREVFAAAALLWLLPAPPLRSAPPRRSSSR